MNLIFERVKLISKVVKKIRDYAEREPLDLVYENCKGDNMFGIFTENKTIESEFGETVLPASIIIGDFKEGLQIPVTYWSVEQYRASWLACLEEGIRDESKSTLVVSMYSPKDINFLFSWILYFRGENVIIQNKIIFSEGIDDFSINRLNEYAGEYEAYSEGEKVSEWYTTVD